MNAILTEVHDLFLFLKAVVEVTAITGAGFGWLVALTYELLTKRRA